MTPPSTLAISKKLLSSVADSVFLVNANEILNLWAPGAFVFDTPWALSFKSLSSLGVINDSDTFKPILYDGVFVYLSNIKVESSIWTKNPLI